MDCPKESWCCWTVEWALEVRRLPPEEWKPRKRLIPLNERFEGLLTAAGTVLQFESPDDVNFEKRKGFPDVQPSILQTNWDELFSIPIKSRESITVLEGRALVLAIRMLASHSRFRNQSVVMLCDKFGLVCCLSKKQSCRVWNFSIEQKARSDLLVPGS